MRRWRPWPTPRRSAASTRPWATWMPWGAPIRTSRQAIGSWRSERTRRRCVTPWPGTRQRQRARARRARRWPGSWSWGRDCRTSSAPWQASSAPGRTTCSCRARWPGTTLPPRGYCARTSRRMATRSQLSVITADEPYSSAAFATVRRVRAVMDGWVAGSATAAPVVIPHRAGQRGWGHCDVRGCPGGHHR